MNERIHTREDLKRVLVGKKIGTSEVVPSLVISVNETSDGLSLFRQDEPWIVKLPSEIEEFLKWNISSNEHLSQEERTELTDYMAFTEPEVEEEGEVVTLPKRITDQLDEIFEVEGLDIKQYKKEDILRMFLNYNGIFDQDLIDDIITITNFEKYAH